LYTLIKENDIFNKYTLLSTLSEFYHRVKMSSKIILSLSMRNDHTFFAIGDTERDIKGRDLYKSLSLIYDCEESLAMENTVVFSKNTIFSCFSEGFCFFRGLGRTASHIDFVFLCGWHSHNHKSNDELSFILDYKGETFFDDAGYSPYLQWDDICKLHDEHAHNTIVIDDVPWSEKATPDGRDAISGALTSENGCAFMEAEHYRCQESRMARKVHIAVNRVLLEDFVAPELGRRTRHRFILGKDVIVSKIAFHDFGYVILLTKNTLQARLYCISESCLVMEEHIPVVEEISTTTKLRKVLDVVVDSSETLRIRFFITFDETRVAKT
jgi:hypothetical protein